MKPAKFEYYSPSTLEEAYGLLDKYRDDAKIISGGQSLMPLMNMRLASPKVLVDINLISGLDYIKEEKGELAIGALTRHRTVEKSALLASKCPILPLVAENVAHIQVRNRGTFCGSIAHGDPAAEFPAVLSTLGGTIICGSSSGLRQVPVEEFYLGMLTTGLEPTEIITEVKIPNLVNKKWSHKSVERCHGDFAIAGVIVVLDQKKGGECRNVHLGMYGVGPNPIRSSAAEAVLEGKIITEALISEVTDAAVADAQPESDLRGSAEYRRKLLYTLIPMCLRDALSK